MHRRLRQFTIVLGVLLTLVVGSGLPSTASTTALTGLRVTGWTAGSVGLQWDTPAGGAAGWTFWVRSGESYTPESQLVVAGATISANVPSIVPGRHQLKIVALDAANRPAESATVTVDTNAPFTDTVAPGTPRDLRGGANSATVVGLSWATPFDNTGKLASYQVSEDGGATWKKTARSLFAFGSAGATLIGVRPGTQHRLALRAVDGAGLVSTAATLTVATPAVADATPPSTPGNLRVLRDGSGKAVALTWDAATDNSGSIAFYHLFEVAPDLILSAASLHRFSGGSTRLEIADLRDAFAVVPGQTYTVNLRAHDATGNIGGASNSVTFTA